jgi:hypothetical protein
LIQYKLDVQEINNTSWRLSDSDFLKSWQYRITTIVIDETNMGMGPKNHSRKLRAKYSALSPSNQNSLPLLTALSTFFTPPLSVTLGVLNR